MNTKITEEKSILISMQTLQRLQLIQNIDIVIQTMQEIKQQIDSDALDADGITNVLNGYVNDFNKRIVNYKIVDNQIKLLERVTKGE